MKRVAAVILLPSCANNPLPVLGVSPTCKLGAAKIGAPLADEALVELSGLAASRAHPGVLYAHDDSGDPARFFAMGSEGQALGRFERQGAVAVDWEDVTLGPCPAGKQAAGDPSVVFKFPMPQDASTTVTLIQVAQLPVPEPKDQAITGGSLSPDGTSLLLRTYDRVVELNLPAGAPFEQLFAAKPINVAVSTEQQGEAVAWSADGRGYFTAARKPA